MGGGALVEISRAAVPGEIRWNPPDCGRGYPLAREDLRRIAKRRWAERRSAGGTGAPLSPKVEEGKAAMR